MFCLNAQKISILFSMQTKYKFKQLKKRVVLYMEKFLHGLWGLLHIIYTFHIKYIILIYNMLYIVFYIIYYIFYTTYIYILYIYIWYMYTYYYIYKSWYWNGINWILGP